jgi:polycystin 1L2
VKHDSSGKGNMASWYLKLIVVHDLQTRDKSYFICNNWLAIEGENTPTNILLPVAGNAQKHQLKYILEKQSKEKLADTHMWLSVFTRPVHSTFTRTDRLTCCFVTLCISLLMNILYYDLKSESTSQDALKIGPIKITFEEVENFKAKKNFLLNYHFIFLM